MTLLHAKQSSRFLPYLQMLLQSLALRSLQCVQVTMLLVMNNALQGILSSFFFKYADTILKKYSSTMATIVTGIMSAALFGHSLTLNFLIGVTVVFISMHQFFSQGAAWNPSFCGLVLLRGACTVYIVDGPHHMYGRAIPREQAVQLLQNAVIRTYFLSRSLAV